MKIRGLSICLAVLFVAAIVASDVIAGDDSAAGSHRRVSSDCAEVGFVTLKDGDVVTENFSVQFSVSGMTVEPAGTDIENTGHHHLLIDVDELPDPNLPIPKDDHFLHFGGGQTETVLTLPAGDHTLQLLFGDYAHIPHHPMVKSESITIHVTADAPVQD